MTPTRSMVLGANLPCSIARLNSAAAFSVIMTAMEISLQDGEFSQVMVSLLYATKGRDKGKVVNCSAWREALFQGLPSAESPVASVGRRADSLALCGSRSKYWPLWAAWP